MDDCIEGEGFVSDVTGLIGQYAHGNEPSHHVAYLYSYADRKDKTQACIRDIFDRFYLPNRTGCAVMTIADKCLLGIYSPLWDFIR